MLLLTAVFCGLFARLWHRPYGLVWLEDLPVYASAIQAFLRGGDPYAVNHFGLHFVYPPLVLYPAGWCARLLPVHVARLLFVGIHLAAVLALPYVLARWYVRARWWGRYLPLLVLVAEPGFAGFRALFSANIAPALYLAAWIAALPGVRHNRWRWFYGVVILAALVKVTFLVLLLLPLLAGRQQWLRSVAAGAIVAGASLLEQRSLPVLFAGYKAALVQQVSVQQLYGYGIFGFAARLEHHVHGVVGAFALGVHAVVVLLMIAVLLLLQRRHHFQPGPLFTGEASPVASLWLGLLIITVILANPRILHYDIYIPLFAAFAIIALACGLNRWKLVALAVALHLPSFLVILGVRSWALQQAWQLGVVLCAFAVGAWTLWRSAPSPTSAEPRVVADRSREEAALPAVSA